MRITGLFLLFILAFTNPLEAQEVQPSHALAMHGAPKYETEFKYLSYANPEALKGGRLTQCVTGMFDTLNDNTMRGKPARGLHLLNDPLMRRVWGEPFSLYGVIAKSVIVPDDRSTITFNLNPKARFHDGSPISSEDVEYSFNILKEKGKPNTRSVYKLVDKVQVMDEHTIRFDFGDGHNFETAMILAMMPIYSKAYWESRDFDATGFDKPVGNGPYKIKNIDEGRSITYERVKDYWAADNPIHVGHYNFDEMHFQYFRDDQVALEAFKAGTCDFRSESNPAKWAVNYKDGEGYITEALPHDKPEATNGFIMNTRREPLNNNKVRQALTLAFDFDWMNRTLFYGEAKRINSLFSNSALASGFRHEKLNKRTALKKADDLLTQAGYPLENGQRFTLSLLLNRAEEEKIALAYARDLKRLGIILDIKTLDTVQFTGALNDYDYDLISWRWVNTLSPGTEQAIYWGCAAAEVKGSRNYAGICNPHIDKVIAQLADTRDYETLNQLAKRLDRMIMERALFVPLYYTGVNYVAYWPPLNRPENQSLYGNVIETWWMEQ
jgi:ABC-type oligopeptide transport system substrate-binding subunit